MSPQSYNLLKDDNLVDFQVSQIRLVRESPRAHDALGSMIRNVGRTPDHVNRGYTRRAPQPPQLYQTCIDMSSTSMESMGLSPPTSHVTDTPWVVREAKARDHLLARWKRGRGAQTVITGRVS